MAVVEWRKNAISAKCDDALSVRKGHQTLRIGIDDGKAYVSHFGLPAASANIVTLTSIGAKKAKVGGKLLKLKGDIFSETGHHGMTSGVVENCPEAPGLFSGWW